ncbi:hypothetical protein PIB30_041026, partial [Stylosanthes scabra]|nr:hypothetical protein [Stylosanthes scabra]
MASTAATTVAFNGQRRVGFNGGHATSSMDRRREVGSNGSGLRRLQREEAMTGDGTGSEEAVPWLRRRYYDCLPLILQTARPRRRLAAAKTW